MVGIIDMKFLCSDPNWSEICVPNTNLYKIVLSVWSFNITPFIIISTLDYDLRVTLCLRPELLYAVAQ